jgi:hypothetical protein|tara:strand:+ start:2217 stop:2414 length:198 start_codon:yes stop_codon:yes gene_type:complete
MDLDELKRLSGVNSVSSDMGENISHTASEKSEYMKKHNIQPGTQEWFKLWFAQPHLTGENPMSRK